LLRGTPGNGGDGSPAGEAGSQPPGIFLSEIPGDGGNGAITGAFGESLGYDLNEEIAIGIDGETCGEALECEEILPTEPIDCENGFTQIVTVTEKGLVLLTDGSGGSAWSTMVRTSISTSEGLISMTFNYSGPDTSYINVFDKEAIFERGLSFRDHYALGVRCDGMGNVVFPGTTLTYNFYRQGQLEGVLTYEVSGCLPDYSNLYDCQCTEIENGNKPYNYELECLQDEG
jgi:hypothetical protein